MKKLNVCNIPLSESEEYDIWLILSMNGLNNPVPVTVPSSTHRRMLNRMTTVSLLNDYK